MNIAINNLAGLEKKANDAKELAQFVGEELTEMTKLKGVYSDLRINISQPDVGQMSFDKQSVEKSIEYGQVTTEKYVNKLKKLLQD